MNKRFSLLIGFAVAFVNFSYSQATLNFNVNTWQAIQSGQAAVTHTQTDIGSTADIFDGNFSTVARSAGINPMVVTLAFDYTINVTSMATQQNSGGGWWTVEAANSVAELDNHNGAYQVLFSQSPLVADVPSTKIVNVSAKAFRLTMQRTQGDLYVHLQEWAITATAAVQINSLCFRPNEIKMIKNATYQMKLMGVDSMDNQYPLTTGTIWASSNTSIAKASNSGLLTSFGTTGQTNLTAYWNGLSKILPLKVVDDFTMPLAPQRTVKVALVIIDPPIPAAGGQRFSQVKWTEHYGAPLSWEQLSNGSPMQLAQKVRDSLTAVSGGVAKYEFVETHDEPKLLTTFGQVELTVDSAYRLFREPSWTTWHTVAEQQGQSVFHYNELLDKYNFCEKSNNHQIDEVWIYAMPFIGLYETNMTGTGAFWINGPVITGNSCTDLLNIMGLSYERTYDLALHNFGHRTETTLYHLFNTTVRYVPTDPPYPPGTENELRQFMAFDATAQGKANIGNIHYPPNSIENYGYYNTASVTTYDQNWKRYPFLFQQTRQINCSDWNCEHDGFMRWWLRHLPKYKCLDKNGYLNNWWLYVIDYNEGKAMESQLAGCDCDIFDDAPSGDYCASKSNFPWEDWIAKVKVGSIDNASGKSPYSNFTNLSTNLNIGQVPVQLTTGFSYFTWDEYWRVWIDLNHDGDFEDAGEKVFEGIKSKPASGTPTTMLSGSLNIPTTAMNGPTRMRVTMKRGAYATPCETIPFGEIEDYTVDIAAGPAPLPNLQIVSPEIIPANSGFCYTNPGQPFNYLGGLVLNSGAANAGAFKVRAFLSKDNLYGPNDIFWQEFTYPGVNQNDVVSWNVNAPVPATVPPGTYFILIKADADNMVAESNENDNQLSAATLIGAPDFTVSNVNGVPANTTAGSALSIGVEVTNLVPFPLTELNGDLAIKVYLSNDNQLSPSQDLEIGTANLALGQFSNGPLFNGGKTMANVAAQLPVSVTAGGYFIFADVSYSCEISSTNNTSSAIPIQIGGGTPGSYCQSYSNFPWEDWIAKVELTNLTNPSGKSVYSNFTSKTADVTAGQTYQVKLTAGYSYYTWDEYWRVWIDYNMDGDFTDSGEMAYSGILSAPPNGTSNAALVGTVLIPNTIQPGATTRMRVSMKRGAFPTPCEILPYGEVEDYSIKFSASGLMPNLRIPYVEIIPANDNCFTNIGQTFAHIGGLVLNDGNAVAGPFKIKALLSKDDQPSSNDLLWKEFSYNSLASNDVASISLSDPVPASVSVGKYFLLFQVDPEGIVVESNEADNLHKATIQIGAPDFTASSINGLPASTIAGSTFNASIGVKNLSPFPLLELSGNLAVRLYLSADNVFSISQDIEIGLATIPYNQFSNGPLYGGGVATASVAAQIPGNTLQGDYFFFVEIADGCEQSIANNRSSALPIHIGSGTPGQYCMPNSDFPWEDWIANVKLNTIDKASGKSTYSNYTALSTTLEKGVSYALNLTTAYSWYTWDEYWSVWVDLNHDFVFSQNELLLSKIMTRPSNGTSTKVLTGTLTIPNTATNGPTRMRVVMKRGAFAGSCENIPFGEIEDYTVNIVNQIIDPSTEDRIADISLEARREMTWVNLYALSHFPAAVSQIEVERSENGVEYELLKTIAEDQPANTTQLFVAKDERPLDGTNYYRLLYILENGEEAYSPVRMVYFDQPMDFTLFPNPASSELFIYLNEKPEGEINWKINDAYGRQIIAGNIYPGDGFPYRININELKPGMYYLFADQSGRKAVSRRFVVVK